MRSRKSTFEKSGAKGKRAKKYKRGAYGGLPPCIR